MVDRAAASESAGVPAAGGDVELSEHQQRHNSRVFIINTSLNYFIAPVMYVGILQAAIFKTLGTSGKLANLPTSVFLWSYPIPVLVAWVWSSPRLQRPIWITAYLLAGTAGGATAGILAFGPRAWWVPTIVAHAGAIGVTNGLVNMCAWEMLGRGLSPTRRAWTLAVTFGAGPILAVLGSSAAQLVLGGANLKLFGVQLVQIAPIPAPWSYALLFAATLPATWLSAAFAATAVLPPLADRPKQDGSSHILRGIRDYAAHPLIVLCVIGFLLSYSGTMILNNLGLYIGTATGSAPEEYAGVQQTLRFGFKCAAGFALGWLMARTHPKAPMLATTSLAAGGVVWALVAPGKWYLVSIGLVGAGELFYVYYLNYIIACSAPDRMRENTAYTNLLGSLVVGAVPLLYGAVADNHSLKASFGVALGLLLTALAVAAAGLPRHPARRE